MRTATELWELIVGEGDNGLEVTHDELKRIISSSVEILGPGDGLKIERESSGNFIVRGW